MNTQPLGSDNHLKAIARILIVLLGLCVIAILLLASVNASLAHGVRAPVNDQRSLYQLSDSHFNQTGPLTATITATVTLTPTQVISPTMTFTPTPTGTLTPTPTSTATSSTTPTATPTVTGTPPTPTATGTLTPNPSIAISVSPSQASVTQSFTFTIVISNLGTATSHNNFVISSSLPNYMTVTTVTTSVGIITKLTRSFSVSIGDLVPGEQVTIITIARVNSSPATNEIQSETITLTYDVGQSKTASRSFTVVASVLPGTGELPLNWRGERIMPVGMITGVVLMCLGSLLLAIVVWSKGRLPKYSLWMAVGGALLVLVGFFIGATAFGIFNPNGLAEGSQVVPTSNGSLAQGQPQDTSPTGLPWRPASEFSTPDAVIPIVTLPDYPIPTPKVTITPKPGEAKPDTSAVVRIVIPAMMLDTVVKYVPYDGFSWLISGLRHEIAWMGNTSWPGLGSNTALAGHVTVAGIGDGPFRHLEDLESGELVLLYTEENVYSYQVRQRLVTDDEDMSVVKPTNNPQISLITCVDWDDETHSYLNRLVVIADLVRTDPIAVSSAH